MPKRPAPRATVFGKIVRDDYTVEKVRLESYPDHFVTGNLYRPRGLSPPYPGVLSPHGHWGGGRFHAWNDDELAKQLASGGEHSPACGRYPLQARCVQLARMGCVVFMYDMLGYADSRQLSMEAIHAPSSQTILTDLDGWGFYSVQAELRMQGPLGVQTYNSLCALDWLASLADVDSERIGVTGGSSGATQTLMLCAVDDRPKVAFPVVMVSTAMQGGCPCENACCLRMGGTSNVEFAALMAPKPLGMASADDWTRNFANDGYPELLRLYRMLGVEHRLTHASLTQFPHNYNFASREAMYPWLAKWLGLGPGVEVRERDFVPLSRSEMSVWDDDHPAEPAGRQHEIELMRSMASQSQAFIERLTPHDEETLDEMRRVLGGAFSILLDDRKPEESQVSSSQTLRKSFAGYTQQDLTIHCQSDHVDLKSTLLRPPRTENTVLWIHPLGARGLFDAEGDLCSHVVRLLDNNIAVMGVDLLAQPPPPEFEAQTVSGARPVASLTFGYNRTIVAYRTSDMLAALSVLRTEIPEGHRGIVASGGTAAYAAAATALARDRVDAVMIDTRGFRFSQLTSWRAPDFLPGAVKYGDLPGILALAAPRSLILLGERPEQVSLTLAAYAAANAAESLTIAKPGTSLEDALEQLIDTLKNQTESLN